MKMDRELQFQILTALREVYPDNIDNDRLPGYSDQNLQPTLYYLFEHRLIDASLRDVVGAERELLWPRITARGLDFLEADGGISALLHTVNVRFDANELRELIAARIETGGLPVAERDSLRHAIRSLPAEGLRHVTLRLLDAAMDRLPDVFRLLQTSMVQFV